MRPLVSCEWLKQNLNDVVVLDGSYYLAAMGKDADAEFEKGHILGAQRWNIDEIADTSSTLKHMMPAPRVIAEAAAARGIGRNTPVVVYDQIGMFSAARVWLALKTIGHPHVALLDGGFPAWTGPTATGKASVAAGANYQSYDSDSLTVGRAEVAGALAAGTALVLDARSAGRFNGTDPEPVAGLLSGHMPGALNVPYTVLLDESGLFKPVEELREIFEATGLTGSEPVITSCGSGVTACIVTFALSLLEIESSVYDGSWSEWGQPDLDMPVV